MWFGAALKATEDKENFPYENENDNDNETEEDADHEEEEEEEGEEEQEEDSDYKTEDGDDDEEDDEETCATETSLDLQSELRNLFFERLKKLSGKVSSRNSTAGNQEGKQEGSAEPREEVDMKYENQMFALEARLHFLFFWLNDKDNWLKTLSKDQMDFLRDVLAINGTDFNETPSVACPPSLV